MKNHAASVKRRLRNLSTETQQDFQVILTRYCQEQFLCRLSQSEHKDSFILKGAMLFVIWDGKIYRNTQDMDLLAFGSDDPQDLKQIIKDIILIEDESSGLIFDGEAIVMEPIMADMDYNGWAVYFNGMLERTKIRMKVDVGFGDAANPILQEWPSLLKESGPHIRTYNMENSIAEKFHTMIKHGFINSRMKDFFDIDHLSLTHDFDSAKLREAIMATFSKRETELPSSIPLVFTSDFYDNDMKSKQWDGFLKKVTGKKKPFAETMINIKSFILPLFDDSLNCGSKTYHWKAKGPWLEDS